GLRPWSNKLQRQPLGLSDHQRGDVREPEIKITRLHGRNDGCPTLSQCQIELKTMLLKNAFLCAQVDRCDVDNRNNTDRDLGKFAILGRIVTIGGSFFSPTTGCEYQQSCGCGRRNTASNTECFHDELLLQVRGFTRV